MRIYPWAINPATVRARVRYILGCHGELFVGCTAVHVLGTSWGV